MSFKDLATCSMPPPCMEGWRQFRMPGTNSMCCRRAPYNASSVTGGPYVRPRKPCTRGHARCERTGRCVLRRNLDTCGLPRVSKNSEKEMLKNTYAEMVNGKMRYPPFITSLKGVNGATTAIKLANVARVLDICRRAGIPLLKQKGNGFKAYSTLRSTCKEILQQSAPSMEQGTMMEPSMEQGTMTEPEPVMGYPVAPVAPVAPVQPDFAAPFIDKQLDFGKRRSTAKKSKRVSKKLPLKIRKLCRKLKIKTTKKVGKSRVTKSLNMLKKLIAKKMRALRKSRK